LHTNTRNLTWWQLFFTIKVNALYVTIVSDKHDISNMAISRQRRRDLVKTVFKRFSAFINNNTLQIKHEL